MRKLNDSESDSLSYDQVVFSSLFNGDEAALRSMQRAELITVAKELGEKGTELRIRFTRPLFKAAVRQMMSHPGLGAGMNIKLADTLMADLKAQLKNHEEEYAMLKSSSQVSARCKYLAVAINECNSRLAEIRLERENHAKDLLLPSFNA